MGAELFSHRLVPQRVIDRRFQVSELFARIVAGTFEEVTVEITRSDELLQRVGDLNLATGASAGLREERENFRRKDVASNDRQTRWRIRLRLLHHPLDAVRPI